MAPMPRSSRARIGREKFSELDLQRGFEPRVGLDLRGGSEIVLKVTNLQMQHWRKRNELDTN
jgi:preprotein translocase subunit SecD